MEQGVVTRDRRLITVQARDGLRVHAVLAMGDSRGRTLCGRDFSNWLVIPDVEPNCKDCRKRGYL